MIERGNARDALARNRLLRRLSPPAQMIPAKRETSMAEPKRGPYPDPAPTAIPCRESAAGRLGRIVAERREELLRLEGLLQYITARPGELTGPADELLWNLLRECELHR